MTNAIEANVAANNVEAIETAFYRALGNGKLAASHMRDLIKSVVSSRDTTIIAKAIYRAKEKSDDKAASVLSTVTREVFPDAKITKDKSGKFSIKIKGIAANEKAIERLNDAVNSGLSIRGATFLKAVKGEKEKTETQFDAKAWAERAIKAQGDENIDAMIAALQAKRGVNANARDSDAGIAH